MEATDGAGDAHRPHQGHGHAPVRHSSARHAPRHGCALKFFNADESEAIVFERYRDADAALAHFANIGHLMAPLMQTATVTGELLGTPNDQIRANLTGDQPKLFTPWMALQDEPAAAD
jgi:hypothetical protein